MAEDTKEKIKQVILDLEEREDTVDFRIDEIVEEAKTHGISEEATKEALHELEEDGYIHIHHARGGKDIISRTFWRDYSPAYEEIPQF